MPAIRTLLLDLGSSAARHDADACAPPGPPSPPLQIENEYGFCGSDKDYLRHLVRTARAHLGDEILLFTTGPP